MKAIINRLANSGISSETPINLEKHIRLCNRSAMMVSLCLVPLIFKFGYEEAYFVCFTTLFIVLWEFVTLYLNHLKRYDLARVSFLVFNSIVAFTNSTILGQDAYIFLYYLSSLSASFAFFQTHEQWQRVVTAGLAALAIILDLIVGWRPFPIHELPSNVLYEISLIEIAGAVGCLLYFMMFFLQEYEAANVKLQRNAHQLRLSERKFKNIANNSPGVVFEWYMMKDRSKWGFNYLSPRINDLLNLDYQKAIKDPNYLSSHIYSEDAGDFFAFIKDVIYKQQENQYQYRFVDANGEVRWASLAATPIHGDDDKVIYNGIVSDITSLKKTEQVLMAAKEKAEEATAAKANFLATMSHEIRTPMNAVIGIAHLLQDDNPKPEQVESINILKFAAENLLSLINDILDFSKIEAGKITLEEVTFCMPDLLKGIEKTTQYHAIEKGIVLEVFIDERLPECYEGDPTRLSQILINLLSNAVKFTEQGRVKLAVKLVGIRNQVANIEFSVTDTGIGISEENLGNIFEHFSQADSATTRTYGGSGLGLAITKGLLDAHDSQVRVKSEVGVGTTFSFSLNMKIRESDLLALTVPGCLEQDPSQRYSTSQQGDFSCYSILLVEDNPVNVMVAEKILKKWGAALDIVNNGEQAVNQVMSKDYDLVLMDIQMPIMDGYQATKAIRGLEEGRFSALPIIALTATATEDTKEAVFAAGMNDYLSKPFNPKQLKESIQRLTLIAAE